MAFCWIGFTEYVYKICFLVRRTYPSFLYIKEYIVNDDVHDEIVVIIEENFFQSIKSVTDTHSLALNGITPNY